MQSPASSRVPFGVKRYHQNHPQVASRGNCRPTELSGCSKIKPIQPPAPGAQSTDSSGSAFGEIAETFIFFQEVSGIKDFRIPIVCGKGSSSAEGSRNLQSPAFSRVVRGSEGRKPDGVSAACRARLLAGLCAGMRNGNLMESPQLTKPGS